MNDELEQLLPAGDAFHRQRATIMGLARAFEASTALACGLVGSYGRQTCSPHSDIDVLAVAQEAEWAELFTRHDLVGQPDEFLLVTELPGSFITGDPFVAYRFRNGIELTVHWAIAEDIEPGFALRHTVVLFEKQPILSQLAAESRELTLETDAYLDSLHQRFWHGLLLSLDYLERGEYVSSADWVIYARCQLTPMLRVIHADERALDWFDSAKGLRDLLPPAEYELIVQSVALPRPRAIGEAIGALLKLHQLASSRLELDPRRDDLEAWISARLSAALARAS